MSKKDLKNPDDMTKDELVSELVLNGVFTEKEADAFEKLSKDNLELLVIYSRKKNEEIESSKQEVVAWEFTVKNLEDELEKQKISCKVEAQKENSNPKEKEVDPIYEERRNKQALVAFAKKVGEIAKELAQSSEDAVKVKV